MDIDAAYPSKYLKASDLQGRQPTVTIDRVVIEEVGRDKEQRPVIYFVGKEKGMVLNRTNANSIMGVYGKETNGWAGRQVTLFTIVTEFNRQMVDALRIKPAAQQQAAAAAPPQQQAPNFTQQPPNFTQQPPNFTQQPPPSYAPSGNTATFSTDDIPF